MELIVCFAYSKIVPSSQKIMMLGKQRDQEKAFTRIVNKSSRFLDRSCENM
jgi:hypothetical protein